MPKLTSLAYTLLAAWLYSHSAQATDWQTVAADHYKLLWKTITYTQLHIDPSQPAPADGDILNPAYGKQIVIEYGLAVSAERFRKLTLDRLEDSYSDAELAAHRPAIERFNSWYLGVEKGDRYRLSWQPAQGLSLFHNDHHLGTLNEPQAAAVILSVWLGRAAISEEQRDYFLGEWRGALSKRREG